MVVMARLGRGHSAASSVPTEAKHLGLAQTPTHPTPEIHPGLHVSQALTNIRRKDVLTGLFELTCCMGHMSCVGRHRSQSLPNVGWRGVLGAGTTPEPGAGQSREALPLRLPSRPFVGSDWAATCCLPSGV